MQQKISTCLQTVIRSRGNPATGIQAPITALQQHCILSEIAPKKKKKKIIFSFLFSFRMRCWKKMLEIKIQHWYMYNMNRNSSINLSLDSVTKPAKTWQKKKCNFIFFFFLNLINLSLCPIVLKGTLSQEISRWACFEDRYFSDRAEKGSRQHFLDLSQQQRLK